MAMAVTYCIASFLLGALTLAAIQALLLWRFFSRLLSMRQRRTPVTPQAAGRLSSDAEAYSPSKIFIEGDLWVAFMSPLQLENAVRNVHSLRLSKERKPKREAEEFSVALKHGRLQDRTLLLLDSDDSSVSIRLEGCKVFTVSSTLTATRKWAKKYPLKLELKDVPESVCLLYFRTGWEKESWCEALRAASRRQVSDSEEDSYSKLKCEFAEYLGQLKQNCPQIFKLGYSSVKSFAGQLGAAKKSVSWKRLLRKRSNKSLEGRKVTKSVTIQAEEVRPDELLRKNSDDSDAMKWDTDQENSSIGKKDSAAATLPGALQVDPTAIPKVLDGGVAAVNTLASRLFFDLYHSSRFISNLQRRLQNALSRIPTPSYISPIICSHIDIGKAPPVFAGLRSLPIVDDAWGVEADLDYQGGFVFTLETRLDLRESRFGDNKCEPSSAAAAATTDIINKSIQTVEDDLETADASGEPIDLNSGKGNAASGSSNNKRRWSQWRTIVSSLAEQVSQMPLVLCMRVVSLKGNLQLRIKAAPSDRIWYGFSSMPELELVPEPSFGEHKITTGPLLAYIAERIQILISETVVLPNCEDIYVPWMLSEEEDWIQETDLPLPQALNEVKSQDKCKPNPERTPGVKDVGSTSTAVVVPSSELETPLLTDRAVESDSGETVMKPSSSDGETSSRQSDPKKKKGSKRERMISLGKRFEEKTRNFAERMRERFEKD